MSIIDIYILYAIGWLFVLPIVIYEAKKCKDEYLTEFCSICPVMFLLSWATVVFYVVSKFIKK